MIIQAIRSDSQRQELAIHHCVYLSQSLPYVYCQWTLSPTGEILGVNLYTRILKSWAFWGGLIHQFDLYTKKSDKQEFLSKPEAKILSEHW